MPKNTHALSLIELMVIIAIISILASVGVPTYKNYIIRTRISSLMRIAEPTMRLIEEQHNNGKIFGGSNSQSVIDANANNKPEGLYSLTIGNYGCVKLEYDLDFIGLDSSGKQAIISWCPKLLNGVLAWQCGYDPNTFTDYLEYFPTICQTDDTTLFDSNL